MWYRSGYNQTASDAWRYNNPVNKLMTDKLQLMLINVLLDHFLNIKVSQGSVVTRLRCSGICNDQFITQSLLSPRVKEFWKSVNICRSYGQLSTGLFFFYETRCIVNLQGTEAYCGGLRNSLLCYFLAAANVFATLRYIYFLQSWVLIKRLAQHWTISSMHPLTGGVCTSMS